MKLLITGGFGYLGGRLAQYLAEYPPYQIYIGSRRKVKSPVWLPTAGTIQINWDSDAELLRICSHFDVIIHLAGMNALACANDPNAAMKFNCDATSRLLHAAEKQRVKRFIYLSTAHVYGKELKGVITEKTMPFATNPYGASKLAAEQSVLSSQKNGDLEGVVMRLANAFGAPVDVVSDCWMLLVNDLCKQVVETGKIKLKSDGEDFRNFVPITDAIRAIKYLIEMPGKSIGNGIFNYGGNSTIKVKEMAALIALRSEYVLGFIPKIELGITDKNSNKNNFEYCSSKIFKIGFKDKIELVNEVDNLIKYCKNNFKYRD